MENGTIETAIGTNNTLCVFICTKNNVTSKEICSIPAWADKETLQEVYIVAFNKHLTRI